MGCGWLGHPLAKALMKEGHQVYGSTTNENKLAVLKKEGIKAFQIELQETKIKGDIKAFLQPLDLLIINVPPKLRGKHQEDYRSKIELLFGAVRSARLNKIIFVSSTSVYGDIEGEVTEETKTLPARASGKQLLAVETLLKSDKSILTTVLRFGGLIGPGRHPVTILSGRTALKNGENVVNLIHLDDCIGIIQYVIKNELWNETFNGVYPDHPRKSDYYTAAAKKRGLKMPQYVLRNSKNRGKKIISRNILNKKYHFSTPIT